MKREHQTKTFRSRFKCQNHIITTDQFAQVCVILSDTGWRAEADASLIFRPVFILCITVPPASDASHTRCGLYHHFLPAVYSHNFLQHPIVCSTNDLSATVSSTSSSDSSERMSRTVPVLRAREQTTFSVNTTCYTCPNVLARGWYFWENVVPLPS